MKRFTAQTVIFRNPALAKSTREKRALIMPENAQPNQNATKPADQNRKPPADEQAQEPGFSQKTNQNQQKEDPLAS
jgi:hypothetical protein